MGRFLNLFGLLCAAVVFVSAEDENAKPKSWNSADKKGRKFLRKKLRSGEYKLLESGMMYKVLEEGTGTVSPKASTSCDVHYAGTLINGKEFDSSIKRGEPTTFAPNQVIGGWTEALQLMVEGEKWEVVIPPKLAYGESGAGADIPGKAVLIFTIHIVKINDATATVPRPEIKLSSWMPPAPKKKDEEATEEKKPEEL